MKLYLAPIMGVTDAIYRDTFAKYFTGVDCAIAPFVSSVASRKLKPNYLKDLAPDRNKRLPLTPQILSKNADDFLFIAEKIGELGYEEINWNLGCPVAMVAKKNRGSGLLPFPDQIDSILDAVCRHWPHALSIKTRLGRHSPQELLLLLEIFDRYPLKEVIIHPRLGVQMYNGTVDLESFRNCLNQSNHSMVYNGDITSKKYFSQLQNEFESIDSWMIGRGLLRNPFLAEQCSGVVQQLSSGSCRKKLVLFHNELFSRSQEALFGPSHLLGRMKAVWNYLGHVFVDSHKIIKLIKKCTKVDKYNELVTSFFETKQLAFEEAQ